MSAIRGVILGGSALAVGWLVLFLKSGAVADSWPSVELAAIAQDQELMNTGTFAEQAAVINFWASWCIACRTEHTQLINLSGDGSTRVFGVNHLDTREDARRWLGYYGDPFQRSVFDGDGVIAEILGIEALPVTLVVDAGGHIRYRHNGPLDTVTVETIIRPLLKDLRQSD